MDLFLTYTTLKQQPLIILHTFFDFYYYLYAIYPTEFIFIFLINVYWMLGSILYFYILVLSVVLKSFSCGQ